MSLNSLTLIQVQTGLKNKQFSAKELAISCLQAIGKKDKKINAFLAIDAEKVIAAAKKADRLIAKDKNIFTKKPFLGIPIAIKDNFLTKGLETTASSKVLKGHIPTYNATVVEELLRAGAVILGKTNMDAWAHGSSTETSAFGTTKNPHNLDYLPGGSSGGSAAAAASDMCIAAIGSETAGSIRQPASWCGVVGLKPTYGRVSRFGVIAMASSTDSPGPITKTVKDSWEILKTIAGQDIYDATTADKKLPKIKFPRKLTGLKVGLPKQYFLKELEKEARQNVEEAVKVLEKLGAKVSKVNLVDPKYSIAIYTIAQRAEVSSNLARYDGIRFGNSRKSFGDEAKRRIMLGTYTLSAGYYEAFYKKAQKARTLLLDDFEKVFKKVDVLVAPTSPSVALPVGSTEGQSMFGELQDVLVEASSLAGLPGISVPCGFGKNNLPVGLQIMAPQFREDLIIKVANAYEKSRE